MRNSPTCKKTPPYVVCVLTSMPPYSRLPMVLKKARLIDGLLADTLSVVSGRIKCLSAAHLGLA